MDAPITQVLCRALERYLDQPLTAEVASQVVAQVVTQCYPGPVDTSGIAPEQVGSYVVQCVPATQVLKELRFMHAQHWAETESHRHGLTMNPDYDRVLDLERQGRYLLIVARHKVSGELVGNYGLYLSYSTHTQTKMATEDTLFVVKAHRRGRLGIALIRYAERALASLAVRELNVTVKKVNAVGQMIERMGYQPVGTQYTKLLEGADHVRT